VRKGSTKAKPNLYPAAAIDAVDYLVGFFILYKVIVSNWIIINKEPF